MSTLSREEIEKIVGEFDKISSRTEKKITAMNMKMIIIVITIVLIAIAGGYYLYLKKGKIPTGDAGAAAASAAPKVDKKLPAEIRI